ncbi:MAG TPA: methyltransferase domain-containing protein [Streptosporangiaceae bacterium]|nr:methyltransferase domain-containing protein [Streptosporangiaceae bacterium]
MDTDQLRTQVESFPQWHYEFDLQGVKTPIFDGGHVNRHEQRIQYFFDPLVDLFGGSLAGKRVLDLGCNAGFWSLKAIEAGCDYVLGVDGRQMHVDQANLVFGANSVPKNRYAFRTANVLTDDLSSDGPFDIVLMLGLLYHVSKPVELFERVAAVNTDVLLVDTVVSGAGGSSFTVKREPLDEPRNSIDYETVLIPSRSAVCDLASTFGYQVAPLALRASKFRGMQGFLWGHRLAFMCAKQKNLSALASLRHDEPFARLEQSTRKAFDAARAGLSYVRLATRRRR